jgi:hypothetical protein
LIKTEVVDHLAACLKESECWKDVRKVQKECYQRYRSFRDFSKKQKWQHKMVVPTVYPAIKGAAGLIKKILAKTDTFFTFEPQRQDNAPQQPPMIDPVTGMPIPPPTDRMDNFARAFTKKVRYHVDESDFLERFEEACESAFTMMEGVLRFDPVLEEDAQIIWASTSADPANPAFQFVRQIKDRAKLKCTVVNPLFLSYPLDRSFIIEETRVYLHDLKRDAKRKGYDNREVNKMLSEDYETAPETEAETERRKLLQILDFKNTFRKSCVLHTFHGDLTDKEGKIVMRKCRYIVANKKFLIMKPQPVPYWTRSHPYVFITPLKVLFSLIGAGMIDGVRAILNAIDNVANMMGDKLLYVLLPPNEINKQMLADPGQAESGLIPGKSFATKGAPGKAINIADMGNDLPQGGIVFIEALKKFVQNYTGWTEFMQGMPTVKGETTATEVNTKTQASTLSFENIAESIEKSAIIESVQLTRDFTVQFFMDPVLCPETVDIFMQENIDLTNLPEPEKAAFYNSRYPLKLRGLQAFFDKEKNRQDMIQMLGSMSQIPQLAMRLNAEEFLMRLFTSFDWQNPEMLVLELQGNNLVNRQTGAAIPLEMMMRLTGGGGKPADAGPIMAESSPASPQNLQ